MKKPKRSVASYRAASLKAWRTRKRMEQQKEWKRRGYGPIEDARLVAKEQARAIRAALGWPAGARAILDDILPPEPTINRIPKVQWK